MRIIKQHYLTKKATLMDSSEIYHYLLYQKHSIVYKAVKLSVLSRFNKYKQLKPAKSKPGEMTDKRCSKIRKPVSVGQRVNYQYNANEEQETTLTTQPV